MSTAVASVSLPPSSYHPDTDTTHLSRRRSGSVSSITTTSDEFLETDREQRRLEREQRRLARKKQQEEDFAVMEAEARREREELKSRWGEKIQKSDNMLEQLRKKRLEAQKEARAKEDAKLQSLEQDLDTWRKSRDERRKSIGELSSSSYSTFTVRSRTLSPSRRVPPPAYVPSYLDTSEKRPSRGRRTSISNFSLSVNKDLDSEQSLIVPEKPDLYSSTDSITVPVTAQISSHPPTPPLSPTSIRVPSSPLVKPLDSPAATIGADFKSQSQKLSSIQVPTPPSPSPEISLLPSLHDESLERKPENLQPATVSVSPTATISIESKSPHKPANPVRQGSVMAMVQQQEAKANLAISTPISTNDKVRAALANLPPSVRRRESAKKEAETAKTTESSTKSPVLPPIADHVPKTKDHSQHRHSINIDSGISSASSSPSSSRSNTVLDTTERRKRRVTTEPGEYAKEISETLLAKVPTAVKLTAKDSFSKKMDQPDEVDRLEVPKPNVDTQPAQSETTKISPPLTNSPRAMSPTATFLAPPTQAQEFLSTSPVVASPPNSNRLPMPALTVSKSTNSTTTGTNAGWLPRPQQSTSTNSTMASIQRRANRVSLLVEEQERRQKQEAEDVQKVMEKVLGSRAGTASFSSRSVANRTSGSKVGRLEEMFASKGERDPSATISFGRTNNVRKQSSNAFGAINESGVGKVHEYDVSTKLSTTQASTLTRAKSNPVEDSGAANLKKVPVTLSRAKSVPAEEVFSTSISKNTSSDLKKEDPKPADEFITFPTSVDMTAYLTNAKPNPINEIDEYVISSTSTNKVEITTDLMDATSNQSIDEFGTLAAFGKTEILQPQPQADTLQRRPSYSTPLVSSPNNGFSTTHRYIPEENLKKPAEGDSTPSMFQHRSTDSPSKEASTTSPSSDSTIASVSRRLSTQFSHALSSSSRTLGSVRGPRQMPWAKTVVSPAISETPQPTAKAEATEKSETWNGQEKTEGPGLSHLTKDRIRGPRHHPQANSRQIVNDY